MRLQVAQDEEKRNFANWQLEVGHGKHTDKDSNIDILEQFHCPQNTVESLIGTIYPGVITMPHPYDNHFSECSILSTHNTNVDDLNKRILDLFPGPEKVYHSADSIKEIRDNEGAGLMCLTEYLNSINASGLPLSKLALKKGCPVIVLHNLNLQEGVCNGTQGIITCMANHVIEIRILGGSFVLSPDARLERPE
jgi:PIF1-like helicase